MVQYIAFSAMLIFQFFISCVNNHFLSFSMPKDFLSYSPNLSHMVVDSYHGDVYVAGINCLYHLTSNFSIINYVNTSTQQSRNYNKVLLLHPDRKHLIVCGTSNRGSCEFRNLRNISDVIRFENVEVVSKFSNYPTVAFVSSHRSINDRKEDVLYVGLSTEPQLHLPTISVRTLGKRTFHFKRDDDFFSSSIHLESLLQTLKITFVAGFTSSSYSYFIGVHNSGQISSKIIQICQSDDFLWSFIEVDLKCKFKGHYYRTVRSVKVAKISTGLAKQLHLDVRDEYLVAAFTENQSSVICIYGMNKIRDKLVENVKNCYKGLSSYTHQPYITPRQYGCLEKKPSEDIFNQPDDFYLCNTDKSPYGRIVGLSPVEMYSVYNISDELITSLAITTVDSHTIAFVGTIRGHLKKVLLYKSSYSYSYFDVLLEKNSPVKKDMVLDRSGQYVYTLTNNKLIKVPVSECQLQYDCHGCLSPRDPLCGWCLLENKCTKLRDCQSIKHGGQWLSGNSKNCIYIFNLSPPSISVKKVEDLYLTMNVSSLPAKTSYTCVFMEFSWSSPAIRSKIGLTCKTPDLLKLGISLSNLDHQVITLALNSSQTGVLFLKHNLSFYNCSYYTICKKCTESPWSCDWCIYDNMCVKDSRNDCSPGIVSSRQKQTIFDKRGPSECPHLSDMSKEVTSIPVNVVKGIIIRGHNLPRPWGGLYQCHVHIDDKYVVLKAKYLNQSAIECEKRMYNYHGKRGSYRASVSVIWGKGFTIEDYYSFHVELYKCDVISDGDCGLCVSAAATNDQYKCQWCNGLCQYQDLCHDGSADICPDPAILMVSPLSGPLEGGTNITITGNNLGSKLQDVVSKITVVSYPCHVVPQLYRVSRSIVCTTSNAMDYILNGPIKLESNGRFFSYKEEFTYRNPKILSVFPAIGPKSGGTIIFVSGKMFKTGSIQNFFIGSHQCLIKKETFTDSSFQCETIATLLTGIQTPLTMTFDGAVRSIRQNFIYTDDPVIESISPLTSFSSGGRNLSIKGQHFQSIQQPFMFASDSRGIVTSESLCIHVDDYELNCPSPRLVIKELNRRRRKRSYISSAHSVFIGFKMDAVESLLNVTAKFPGVDAIMLIHPDPVIFNFSERDGIKLFKGEVLVIKGDRLNVAADSSDYRIWIGEQSCQVTSVTYNNIICSPPEDQQPHVKNSNGEFPLVIVTVGNIRQIVGKLEYAKSVQTVYTLPIIPVAVGVAVPVLVLLVVIFIICCVCRQQKSKSKNDYRKMQIQLDTMESYVRDECKQAFAELQTDMTDMTSDLFASQIPFWDYDTYAFKILFPNTCDNSTLRFQHSKGGIEKKGLLLFKKLLTNKNFLLSFIHVLEEQNTFLITDRSNVASLLMVIFQNNMEYVTQIMTLLLQEFIGRAVNHRHPKVLLRRTESVVEKMLSNWLSLCLYAYLKDTAGSPLFILFKAIKLHMEKGPIDALTGDARYSLSEDKLLREMLQTESLMMNVEYEDAIYQCRLLTCDTITQAKSKIVDIVKKNVPYSQRPSVRDLDLVWKDQKGCLQIVSDEDVTSTCHNGWQQLNTLGHYNIKSSSALYLRHKYNEDSITGTLDSSASSSSVMVPLMSSKSTKDDTKTSRKYHIVKQQEDSTKDGTKLTLEVFLTRLLTTKGTLQKYIDDLFSVILNVDHDLPPVIKFLYDFLDAAAHDCGFTDPVIVHTWKSNSLLLRFWVNIIKNPNFVFDIDIPVIVDSGLSVIAQTFMDSCSTTDHSLSKDSPSNKLLFAKSLPKYKKMVEKYFADVQNSPVVSDQELSSYLTDINRMCHNQLNEEAALQDLYRYLQTYSHKIFSYLEQDEAAARGHMAEKLHQLQSYMDSCNIPSTFPV